MPRTPRIIIENTPHHVTQRGNNQQDIFLDDQDRLYFLHELKAQCLAFNISVQGYCLMTNHIHLIVTPCNKETFPKAFNKIHTHYANHFNQKYNRNGHLWQGRYFSCPLDQYHFFKALQYIEYNPVSANIVTHACDYPWSSAYAHVNNLDKSGLLDLPWWQSKSQSLHWQSTLQTQQDKTIIDSLRTNVRKGIPLIKD